MKLYSKLAALGAALVVASAYASADIIPIDSNSGGTFLSGLHSDLFQPCDVGIADVHGD